MNKFIKTKIVNNKTYTFDPTSIYEKIKPNEVVYLDEYINVLTGNKRTINYDYVYKFSEETKNHINFRLKYKMDLLKLQEDYIKYIMADDNALTNIGLYSDKNSYMNDFSESQIPDIHASDGRINHKYTIPLHNDVRKGLLTCPKKALYKPESIVIGNIEYVQQWFIGQYGNQTHLFRLYQEINHNSRAEFDKQRSGISLEIYIRGNQRFGKYLRRADYIPFSEHINIDYNSGELSDKVEVIPANVSHQHYFDLMKDVVFFDKTSTNAKIVENCHTYEEFFNNFITKLNLETTPLYEEQDKERNESLIKLSENYAYKLTQEHSKQKEKGEN